MTEAKAERLERVVRQFRTDERAAEALKVTPEVLVERCHEQGIDTPAMWNKRLKETFKKMAAKRA